MVLRIEERKGEGGKGEGGNKKGVKRRKGRNEGR